MKLGLVVQMFAFLVTAMITAPAYGQFRATPSTVVFPNSALSNPFGMQFFTLFSDNPSSVAFTYTAQTQSGGNWLTVQAIGNTTPASVGVSVNTSGLAAGFYQGTITFTGGSFAPYQVQVQLTVGSGGGGGGAFTVSPSALQFSALQSGSPQTQNVTLTSASAMSYTAFVTSQGGAPTSWLSVSPQSGSNVTFATLGVTVNPLGLATGTYQGQIQVVAGGTTQIILVAFVVSQALTISTLPSLPHGTVGVAYSLTLAAIGGSGIAYSWALVIGNTLPPGLSLLSSGVLSGTPAASGAFVFAIQVADSTSQTATRQFSLSVAPKSNLSISSATLPMGTVDTAYPATALQATGGNGGLTWAIVAGSGQFPPGLTFSTSGIIAGTPTSPGTFTFSVQVLDSPSNIATAAFAMTINASPALSIITTSLPNGTVGSTYSQMIAASGGTASLRWSVASGSLPTGLSLGSSNGVISGSPTSAAIFDFTVQVDSANLSATQRYIVTMFIAPRMLTLFLPGGSTNVPYNVVLQATGGEAPYTWSQTGLPDGLTLDAASGVITGSPTRADTHDVTIILRDSANRVATAQFSIAVQRSGTQTGLSFVAMTPCRIMETRPEYNSDGRTGSFGPPFLAANEVRTLTLPASNVCQIPAAAKAVVLNVTLVPRGPVDFVTVFPADEARPAFWTIRSPDAQIVANAAIVRTGPGGTLKVFTSNTADILLDVAGYFTDSRAVSNLVFYPIAPCRVIDTRIEYRTPAGPFGPPTMNTRETRRFRVPATPYCTIPPGAAAYSVTTTVVPVQSLAYLTTWPSGTAQPIVSSINSFAGRILANSVIVPASSDGSIDVFAFDRTDLIVDINGYFAPDDGANGLLYFPLTQCRVSDSSDASFTGTFGGPIYGDESTRTIQILNSPRCVAIPASAKGYALNITALPSGSPMPYLTAYPTGQLRPIASVLNAFQGQVVTNSAIVPSGAGGAIDIFAYRRTNVVVELSGYFGR